MKRRDFVKNAGLTAFGVSLLGPLEGMADSGITHLDSEDVAPRPINDDGYDLHFMALGDWGRNGEYDQTEVGKQMGLWGAANPNNFVISVGDNFYPKGVISEHDPLWNFSFENIYTAHSLQCDWYPVLGNHDYLSDPDAQIRYSKVSRRWCMPARYYAKEIKLDKHKQGTILFVFIDTDPMLFEEKKDYVATQMAWLDETLKNASAEVKWKIVVGHHPAYTVGPRIKNFDTLTVRKTITETLNKYKADLYLSGHDHSLQHLKPEGFTHQFISGAGSELTPVTTGIPYTKFQASEHGFMYFSVNTDKLRVKAVNYSGKVLYETELSK